MTQSWKTGYEQAVKEYFGIPLDAEITIDDDCTYYEGCPTCGGDYEFTVGVYYYVDDPKGYKGRRGISHTYKGKMTDFLADLPR